MDPTNEVTRPECVLIGEDGNVFAIMGQVRRVLQRAGQRQRADEFLARVKLCVSYAEVLNLVGEYVEIV